MAGGSLRETLDKVLACSPEQSTLVTTLRYVAEGRGWGTRVLKHSHEVSGLPIRTPAPV